MRLRLTAAAVVAAVVAIQKIALSFAGDHRSLLIVSCSICGMPGLLDAAALLLL